MSGFITDKVRQIASIAISESSLSDLQKSIKSMIGELPKEIKISEIVEKFGEHCRENEVSWFDEDYKKIAFYCKKDDVRNWYEIMMDEDEDCPEYKCQYRFMVNSESGSMFSLTTKNRMSKFEQAITRSDFEMLLLRLYHSHGTKIVVDIDQVETEFNFSEEY